MASVVNVERSDEPPSAKEADNLKRSKRKLRNDDDEDTSNLNRKLFDKAEGEDSPKHAHPGRRSYAKYEYSENEGETPSEFQRKMRRTIPRRKIVLDEEGCPNLIINFAEQARLNKYWKHTLIVKLMGRRIT
ncbi:hypothetical protein PIB30_064326 [Stylosanthes scabra]|uniref:Uncharacterized protein n=1 Tax=Stylosanthes scabra TaxID=79078 RepID=A0ABU6VK54_9FABA|nr:hypothetical protein [Stylosanthes scabra]